MTTIFPGAACLTTCAATRAPVRFRKPTQSQLIQLQPTIVYPARAAPRNIVSLRHPACGRKWRLGA